MALAWCCVSSFEEGAFQTGDYFGMVPYPRLVADGTMTLRAAWDELQRPSAYRSGTVRVVPL